MSACDWLLMSVCLSVSHRILWDLWRQVTSHINLHIHDVIASSLHSDEFWHLRSVLNVTYCNTTMPNKAVHVIFSVVMHKTSINSKQEPLILHVNQESLSLYSLNPDL